MNVLDHDFLFVGDETPPAVASPDGSLWRSKIVGSGPPTVKCQNGFMKLALITTAEAQSALLYMGDQLPFDIDDIQQVDIWAKVSSAALHPAISLGFGLISAHNADLDLIAASAMFRCYGNNVVLAESDDGTNDNSVSTGLSIGTSVKRFTLDFASGSKTVVPPPSVGGKAQVLFNMDDTRGNLQGVCRSSRFDMSNYAGGLQLFAQIQKNEASSVVDTGCSGALYIERFRIRRKTS